MRKRENTNRARSFEIDNVVRETPHRRSTSRESLRNVWHGSPRPRPRGDKSQRFIDRFKKITTEVKSLFFVPVGRLIELNGGFWFDLERKDHRCLRRASIRARTSSHGSPVDSPASTRRARLSISFPQAISTSARSSAGSSSRLASNSAATSARSSTGNVSASRNTAWARSVMPRL
ncbi:MAG: hypothetical protein QOI58_3193 [Thermoanaerobaculia bacterium]|nr:hypothetical protein [Thermoanaerobaculia bacterium]